MTFFHRQSQTAFCGRSVALFSPDNRADANRTFPWSTVATRNKDNSRVFPLAIITIYVTLQDNSGKKIPSTQGLCLNLRFYLTSIRRTISDN